MRGTNSQGIILKIKISQFLKKGKLTETFVVNSKSSKTGLEYYIINFYASGRTLINTKNHRKELLEK